MITIGIRAAPSAVTFAIYDDVKDEIINLDQITVPVALDTPDMLKYLRCHLLDILREYEVSFAGIRATEPSAQRANIGRIEIEGVIMESFASSDLEGYYIGHVSSIMSRLGVPRTDFKLFVDGKKDPQIDGWDQANANQREAILCAKGAVNAQ
ncbi:hypothetical protein [Altererythrobacter sp. MTPC7]|uniref:hypothetical protein n=1 Tax=Altererythrobacter sp. MTPC7 TaxID=3056567 RepID=UPI0036F3B2D9